MTKRLWLGRPRCDKCKRECVGDYYVCAACIEAPLAALRERAEAAEKERDEARAEFAAWASHRFKDDLEAAAVIRERDALGAEVWQERRIRDLVEEHAQMVCDELRAEVERLRKAISFLGLEAALAAKEAGK